MVKRIIMPFNTGDYMRDTEHLTTIEHGAYLLLLFHYWNHGGLPRNEGVIRRITRIEDHRAWMRHRPVLAALFQQPGWIHKRVDRDIAEHADRHAKRSAAAIAGWRARPVDKPVDKIVAEALIPRGKNASKINEGADAYARTYKKERKNLPSSAESRPAREDIQKEKKNFKNGNGEAHQAGRDTPGRTRITAPSRPEPKRSVSVATTGSNRRRLQARAVWERTLAGTLGPVHYATAVDLLAADPRLVDRITDAELRKPGSGAMAALLALRQAGQTG